MVVVLVVLVIVAFVVFVMFFRLARDSGCRAGARAGGSRRAIGAAQSQRYEKTKSQDQHLHHGAPCWPDLLEHGGRSSEGTFAPTCRTPLTSGPDETLPVAYRSVGAVLLLLFESFVRHRLLAWPDRRRSLPLPLRAGRARCLSDECRIPCSSHQSYGSAGPPAPCGVLLRRGDPTPPGAAGVRNAVHSDAALSRAPASRLARPSLPDLGPFA